jgi:hypothetical protein
MSVLETDAVGATALRRPFGLRLPLAVTIALIPAVFVVAGLVIRYFAYAAAVPDETLAGFPMGLCRWDCGWYVYIAEHGYHPFPTPGMNAAGNWAFFPLMPVFVGAVRWLMQLPTMTLAMGISIAMSYATAVLAWPLLGRNLRAYTLFSAYLLAGPWSIYFTTFMSEAAFILLTTGVLLALERRNYLAAGAVAGLLSATRIVGVMMAVAMLVQLFAEHRATGKPLRRFVPDLLKRPKVVLGLLLAPLGAFIYMAFLAWWVGDGLAFVHVQRAWARAYGNPLQFLWEALASMPKGGFVPTAPQQLAAAVITGFVLTGMLLRRRKWAGGTFSLISLTIPLFAGMASTLRFTAALAPLALEGAKILGAHRIVFAVALLGFLVADYFVTIAWISGALSLV